MSFIRSPRAFRLRSMLFVALLVALLHGLGTAHSATSWHIGAADGRFESGLQGLITSGPVRLVTTLGALRPPQGTQALLLTTAPDAGVTTATATESLVQIPAVTIPDDATQLRLDYVLLSKELPRSPTDDTFTIRLRSALWPDAVTLHAVTIFTPLLPAPLTGYPWQSGVRAVVIDLTPYTDPGDIVSLEFSLRDVGDGRVESAVLLDNLRFTTADEPQACVPTSVLVATPGVPVLLDGACSTHDPGIGITYHWRFGDGTEAVDRFPSHTYATDGLYRGTLTLTDTAGRSSTASFLVVVGAMTHPPRIVSSPPTATTERALWRYAVRAEDPDQAVGDRLTFTLLEAPPGMSIDTGTGVLTWTPQFDAPRQAQVTVQVEDLTGLRAAQTFPLVVGPEVYVVATDDAGALYYARSNGDGTFRIWSRITSRIG